MRIYNGITFLRAVAAFMIVGCHLQLLPRTTGGALVTSLCDMNVGLFAAISGFLMVWSLEKSGVGVRSYIRKRVIRLMPCYLFWTVFYLLASVFFSVVVNRGIDGGKYLNIRFWIDVVLWGGASCHLWFVASLLYANVLLSVMYAFFRKTRIDMMLFLAIGVLFIALATCSKAFIFRYPCRLVGFVSLGMFANMLLERTHVNQWVSIMFLCFGCGIYAIAGVRVHPFLKSVFIVFPLMFLFARKGVPLFGGGAVEHLAGLSMGVFLWHPFFAAGMAAIIPRFVSAPFGMGSVLSDWFVVYVLSLMGTMVMNRVPVLERFVK